MTDFRALCAELLAEWDSYSNGGDAWDRARAALAQLEPPADGEVAELVAALEADAECVEVEHYDLCNMTAEQMRRAATLLQQLSVSSSQEAS